MSPVLSVVFFLTVDVFDMEENIFTSSVPVEATAIDINLIRNNKFVPEIRNKPFHCPVFSNTVGDSVKPRTLLAATG